jgi:Uncharacterised ArCR, COG2043
LSDYSKNTLMEIGDALKKAGRLETRPLAVYGSETIPEGSVSMTSIDQCTAKTILMAAVNDNIPKLFIGKQSLKGCCLGGITWFGFGKISPFIKYFVSTGKKEFRNGEAEYLKASPEIMEKVQEAVGKITPPGKYLVISPLKEMEEGYDVKSVLCFGSGEQIRNLCSLIHFRLEDPFKSIITPFGPSCATFVTYPAGMSEKAPKNTAYIGPVDPTGNSWFPTNYMALGIPIDMARDMCNDLADSFAVKRPQVAYPDIRNNIIP